MKSCNVSVNNENATRKGGVIMKESFNLEVGKPTWDYLSKIEKAGSDFRLKHFSALSKNERGNIMCELFTKQFYRLCRSKKGLEKFSFALKDSVINVTRELPVKIEGEDIKGEKHTKKVNVVFTALVITPHSANCDSIDYTLELDNKEYDEKALLSRVTDASIRNFVSCKISISDADSEHLLRTSNMEFWKGALPQKVKYAQENDLLVDFIDVLHDNKLTDIDGKETIHMKNIYPEALKVYPKFSEMSFHERMRILDRGYTYGRKSSSNSRDIHLFAKATFEALAEEGLYETVRMEGREYTLEKVYRHNRIIDGKCIERDAIKFIRYSYPLHKGISPMQVCFQPFDLWHVLTRRERIYSDYAI